MLTGGGASGEPYWACWYCPRVFTSQASRTRHMSGRHPHRNRLVQPAGFVELHDRPAAAAQRDAAAAASLSGTRGESRISASPLNVVTPPTLPVALALESPGQDHAHGEHPLLGGLGVVRLPPDASARGSLAIPRPRNVSQTSVAARIRAYYEAMPEAGKTRRLVPPSVGRMPSRFNTPVLRDALKFALSAGGSGLSQADQISYLSVLVQVEDGARHRRHVRRRGVSRATRASATVSAAHVAVEGVTASYGSGSSSDDDGGEISRAFPNKTSFVAAVREEQRRVLSKLCWDETPLEVEGVKYKFYSRDLLLAALDLLMNAGHIQLWGEKLGDGADGTRLREDMMDSDLFLTEELIVRQRHGSLSFVLGVQLFVDEAVVSWSGAQYIYPIRARVVNIRDSAVQWVTVGYIPHVGKPANRTAASRRRAGDARNAVLQRCLGILLRRFVGASQTGVPVEFPGQQVLTAVPRIVGLVAD